MVETIQQQLENAHQLKSQGQLDAAIATYQNIIQLEPHNYLSYNPLGAIFLEQGKYDEAEKVYRQAIELNGENAWWHCNLGRSLLNQRKVEAAITSLQKALELDSEIAEFYFHLGTAFGKQNDFEQATTSYRKAIELEPDKFLYYHQLGDSLLLQGKYEDAVSPYRKAIELNAEYAWSYHNLGKALSELERWEEAIEVYQKATELWPENPDFHYGLGNANVKLGKAEEGILEYRRAIELRPQLVSTSESQGTQKKPIDKLKEFLDLTQKRILVISRRAERIFSSQTDTELQQYFSTTNDYIRFGDNITSIDISQFDAILLLVHLHDEVSILKEIKERNFSGLTIGWFWDNHHHYYENLQVIDWLDICIPAHGLSIDLLQSGSNILDEVAVPVCTTQWTREQARDFFAKHGERERSNSLYGGFTRYDFAARRNSLIEQVQKEIPDNQVILFDREHEDIYFGLSLEERFAQWCSHKVSLCLPLERDLSQRLFDALLCGQIPIVPTDVLDLDTVIPTKFQKKIPIVVLKKWDIKSLKSAHAQAVKLFDMEGIEGVKRRHEFVLSDHLLVNRLQSLLNRLNKLAFRSQNSSAFSLEETPGKVQQDNTQLAYFEYELGEALAKQEKWQEAITAYRKVIELNPSLMNVYDKLGNALKQNSQKNLEDAFDYYRHALEQNPDNIELYHQALEIQPDNTDLYFQLANALFRQQQIGKAVVFYQVVLRLDKNHAETHFQLGQVMEYNHDYNQAIQCYNLAIEIDSSQWKYYHHLAQALEKQEAWEEAILQYRKATKLNPDSELPYQGLGDALTNQRNWQEAIKAYRHAIELNPKSGCIHKSLGDVLMRLNSKDEATEMYRQAIQLGLNLQ